MSLIFDGVGFNSGSKKTSSSPPQPIKVLTPEQQKNREKINNQEGLQTLCFWTSISIIAVICISLYVEKEYDEKYKDDNGVIQTRKQTSLLFLTLIILSSIIAVVLIIFTVQQYYIVKNQN